MEAGIGLRRVDWVGLRVVLLAGGGLERYRRAYVEPVSWGARCAGAAAPLACVPRAGLLWLQQAQLWGAMALALGIWAFFGRRMGVGVAAVAVGTMAVMNYNATWGMLGLALGGWTWIMSVPGGRRSAGRWGG